MSENTPNWRSLMLAAASSAASASAAMIEVVREAPRNDGSIPFDSHVGSGEIANLLADALRLHLEAANAQGLEDEPQLQGALVKFLEDRT